MLQPTLVFDLARLHRDDLMAAAERDRLVRMARSRRLAATTPASVAPARMSALHRITAVWHQLGRAPARVPESGKLAASGQ
jgi:hypothetical protein